MGTLKTARILDAIFGKRAIAGAANLMDGVAALNAFEKSLLDADGVAQRTADRLRQSMGNRLKALSSAATELGFKFINAFEKDGKKGIDGLMQSIRAFDPTPIIDGLKTAFAVTKALLNIVRPFLPLMPVLIGMWISYGLALKGVAIFSAISGFIKFVGILRQTTSVIGIMNAVMLANPVGVIVAGVGLLIGATILLVKHWDKVTQAITGGISKVKSFFGFGKTDAIKKEIGVDFGKTDAVKKEIDVGFGKAEGLSPKAEITPPNREEIEARKTHFSGMLKIAGAPEGSTFEDKSGAPSPINVDMLGQN